MWYSSWITTKRYGIAGREPRPDRPIRVAEISPEEIPRLQGWLPDDPRYQRRRRWCTRRDARVLILGTELLRPSGLLPEDDRMAAVLGSLLGSVWGPAGFWLMIACVFVGFFATLITDQDGFGRLLGSGTRILGSRLGIPDRWNEPERLRKAFVIIWVTLVPIGLFSCFR